MNLFEARHINKTYDHHQALTDVSVHVPEGSIYGLLGPNGAGKTTLIRIINRITGPDSGELMFEGRKFRSEDVARIGYLPEERGLYRKMKVGEQALYLTQLKGINGKEAKKKLKLWFEKFDIDSWWDRKIEELSKGMAQKIQFIVTILHEPRLLIFDEPFSGFDPVNTNLLKKEILSLRDNGATIIFSTHDMASVEELCDHITLINKSKTVLEGSVPEITANYKENIFDLEYEGEPSSLKNHLNGNYSLISEDRSDYGHQIARVKLSEGKSANDLLRSAIESVSVRTFKEILPSMNEIFIKAVSHKSTPTSHE